jgi:hypothetical protein
LRRRFGIKPVGSGKAGTEEGAILSQHGMMPKSGYRFSGEIMPKHVSEDANDQAP